jgi:hypothetical protein
MVKHNFWGKTRFSPDTVDEYFAEERRRDASSVRNLVLILVVACVLIIALTVIQYQYQIPRDDELRQQCVQRDFYSNNFDDCYRVGVKPGDTP